MSEAVITIVGNVATEPRIDQTKKGEPFASFRLACNNQRYDTRARTWVTEDTSFYTIYCWRSPLADNVKASLRKGDPVVVHGKAKNREWRDENNVARVSAEISARTVGHDLYRGTSSFAKAVRPASAADEDDIVDHIRALYMSNHGDSMTDSQARKTPSGQPGELEFGQGESARDEPSGVASSAA